MMTADVEIKEEFASTVTQLAAAAKELHDIVEDIKRETLNGTTASDDKGVSLLSVKNAQLLHYNMQVGCIALQMSHGQSIAKSPCVRNAADIRATLERIRPIEQCMTTELDRLMALSTEAKTKKKATNEPRARLDMMMPAGEVDKGGDEGEEEAAPSTGKYVPPRVMPMHYSEDAPRGSKSREEKEELAKKRRAANSSLIRELHEQYTDAPVEVVDAVDSRKKRQMESDRERKTYEEANYTRLAVNAKQQKRRRATEGVDTLASLLDFGDYGMGAEERKRSTKRSSGGGRGNASKRGKSAKRGRGGKKR